MKMDRIEKIIPQNTEKKLKKNKKSNTDSIIYIIYLFIFDLVSRIKSYNIILYYSYSEYHIFLYLFNLHLFCTNKKQLEWSCISGKLWVEMLEMRLLMLK